MQILDNLSHTKQLCFNTLNNKTTHISLLERIPQAAFFALKKLAAAFALNIAIRITFASFLVPQGTIAISLAAVALSIYSVNLIAQKIFRNKSAPGFLNSFARAAWVSALTMKFNNYIHEYGHALAASFAYVQPESEIFVNHSEGSHTYTVSYGLTRLGQFLGEQRARLFVTAAGLMAPTLVSMGEFALAYGICQNHHEWQQILIDHGFSQLANTLYYGISSFFEEFQLKNDFIHLWSEGGIHPCITLALLIALPLAQVILLEAGKDTYPKTVNP